MGVVGSPGNKLGSFGSLFPSFIHLPQDPIFVLFSRQTIFMFGALLERPLIKPIFEPCYADLLKKLHEELDVCKLILDRHLDNPDLLTQSISKSLPPAAGAIAWSAQLLRRVDAIMSPIELLEYP